VDYAEKTYAAGKIPGGFFKREGRPSEKEILTSRLIDRPIRPLFPDGFYNEVQVVAQVLSLNPEVDADIPAMIAVSAAMTLSGVPFSGPIGAVRVGYLDGQYVINPTAVADQGIAAQPGRRRHRARRADGRVRGAGAAGRRDAGRRRARPRADAGRDHGDRGAGGSGGQAAWDWKAPAKDEALAAKIAEMSEAELRKAFAMRQKGARSEAIDAIWKRVFEAVGVGTEGGPDANTVKDLCFAVESKIVRNQILDGEPRIDGRDTRTVRPIAIRTGVLPRTHGSALFTRGETQALVTVTLGTGRDEQIIDALAGEYRERFMFHYNFPPYSTGETGRFGSPSAARSATAASPSARWSACCRRRRISAIRCASSRRSPSRTVLPRWPRSAAAASR
jgi:polyribonucleotide nucleotidyltransferase